MNTLNTALDNPKPNTLLWMRKAMQLVSAKIVACTECEQPRLSGQRCGSCGHTDRVSIR